jgi:SH3-like domain-containing protein
MGFRGNSLGAATGSGWVASLTRGLLGLYRNWGRLHDPANALTYLWASVLNGCRSALRAQAAGTVGTAPRRPAIAKPFDSTEAAVLLSEEHQEVLAAAASVEPHVNLAARIAVPDRL